MVNREKKHILFLSYHLPMDDEPGAFRPWMEARLMSRAGFKVTVITSGVQYMTGKDIRPGKGWCTEEERRWFEQHINMQVGVALFAKVYQADDQSQQLL